MIKAVGLEMHWLPEYLGSLFIKGNTMYCLEYWYKAIQERNKK